MAHFPHGAIIAAHAAREKQRQEQEEELVMTKYSIEDLEGDWEFKIVRSNSAAFRRPDAFQQLLQEESLAGWELVEKLDDSRVRFKRHRDARRRDTALPPGVDPYRTQYGANIQQAAVIAGLAFLLLFVAGGFLMMLNIRPEGDAAPIFTIAATIPVIIVLIGVVMLVVIKRRNR